MARLLTYDGLDYSYLDTGSPHTPRWMAWDSTGTRGTVVGNRGMLLGFHDEAFRSFDLSVATNLRGVALHPDTGEALLVGNMGTILRWDGVQARRIPFYTPINLRRVAYRPQGDYALAVGNDGLTLAIEGDRITQVGWGEHHLRSVAWHPSGEWALVAGNRRLYIYRSGSARLERVNEEADGDLIDVDWRPGGTEALAVGYRQVGPTSLDRSGIILRYAEGRVEELDLPTPGQVWAGVAWHPGGRYALITSCPTDLPGPPTVLRFDPEKGNHEFHRTPGFNLAKAFFHPRGDRALILGSPGLRFWNV